MKNLFKIFKPTDSLKKKIVDIVDDIKKNVEPICDEKIWVNWYGAYEIDPKNLAIWICIETDAEKLKLESNSELMAKLKKILVKHNYPEQAIKSVYIGFESQETVDRESHGNWYEHFK